MTAHEDRDDRLEDIFHAALGRSPAQREAYLVEACGDDAELLEDLRGLLEAHGEAPVCLEHPLWGLADRLGLGEPSPVGQRIGPYEIKRLLGEGGMGSVYLAHQEQPLRRRVALKLIKLGMDTREVVARFEGERRTLARLDHPNVAAVLDAGVTERGRPYFVMEYVPGERITTWCDRHHLGVDARLEIFATVCDAVHHAHQKGVLHRDIKPSNILVRELDGRAVPKIIDFGVAKAVNGSETGRTRCTRTGQRIGTPGYMSPEQGEAGSRPVDTRTDVFSLGMLLHELLVGELPSGEQEQGLAGCLLDQGSRARRTAVRRRSDLSDLRKRLLGDLQWIVARATAADPEQRYPSASELASDVRRHLDDEPVQAGPPGLVYRARKLARRHRLPVASAAVSLGILVTSLALGLWVSTDHAETLSRTAVDQQRTIEVLEASRAEPLVVVEPAQAAPPGTLARNGGPHDLRPGDVVECLGTEAAPDGSQRLIVGRALAGSGRMVLGVVRGAGRAPTGGGQGIPAAACGDLVELLTHGAHGLVRVDGSAGPIEAHARLGPGALPGLAVAHQGDGPVLGVALEAWQAPGPGMVAAFVAPTWAPPATTVVVPPAETTLLALTAPARSTPDAVVPVAASGWQGPAAAAPADGEALVAAVGGAPASQPEALLANGAPRPLAVPPLTPVSPPVAPAAPVGAGDDRDGGESPTSQTGSQEQDDRPAADGAGEDEIAGLPVVMPEKKSATGSDDREDDTGDTVDDTLDTTPVEVVAESPGMARGVEVVSQAWGDVDGDRLQDVLVGHGRGVTLLHNLGQGSFEDITVAAGLADVSASEARWVDADGDGRLDLLTLDERGRVGLQRGVGGGAFRDISRAAGLVDLVPVADLEAFDSDGDLDVDLRLVTRDGRLLLLINDGTARFQPAEIRSPPASESVETVTDEAVPAAPAAMSAP